VRLGAISRPFFAYTHSAGGQVPGTSPLLHWTHPTQASSLVDGKSSQAKLLHIRLGSFADKIRLGLAWDFSVMGQHLAVWALFARNFNLSLDLMLR